MAMYEISIKIVFLFCMFYNRKFSEKYRDLNKS